MRRAWRIAVALVLVAVCAWAGWRLLAPEGKEPLHIAVVGPLTGRSAENGRSMVQGVRLCLDRVNRQGGVAGHKVVLDAYDDQNDATLAREQALLVVREGRALAVIGHNYSECSLAAGPVYAERGIPAVSPSSTAPQVTLGNPWYFRTVSSDTQEGAFTANYVAKVLRRDQIAVIAGDPTYGRELARIVAENCARLSVRVSHSWEFDSSSPRLDEELAQIVAAMADSGYDGVVFLAVYAPEGAKLVRLMRDRGLNNTIVAPSSFASESFSGAFDDLPQERLDPGHYTNGIYVSTPLLFDSAGEEAQRFRAAYLATHGGEPDWRAALTYDAALVVVSAMRDAAVTGVAEARDEERRRIRNHLAATTRLDLAVSGVTGFNYFDEEGDSQKPIFFGVYHRRNLVSTLTQIQETPSIRKIADLDQALREGRVVEVNDRYMYRTQVVYVGLRPTAIEDLDLSALVCTLDFDLWFRHEGEFDVGRIEFLNAAEEITLGQPSEETVSGSIRYRLYRVRGRFKVDFLTSDSFEEHALGVSFIHRDLTRDNLIFVTDVVGMDLTEGDVFLDELRQEQVLSPSTGWRLEDCQFFPDTVSKGSEGDPRRLDLTSEMLKHSRFSTKLLIRREHLGIRRTLATETSRPLAILAMVVVLLILVGGRTRIARDLDRFLWFILLAASLLLLLGAEVALVNGFIDRLPRYQLALVARVFDVLWWVVPALLLVRATEVFVWRPLERRAGQVIPNIVRRFFAFIVLTLCFFGIIAFVYDQKITSLLATSGMIAMIIGLAIQINISNIFSGIALNIERPFKVGDWVKIGSLDEAKVVDMTWRTTRLLKRDNTILSVPNSTAAEAEVVNFHQPDDTYEVWITFHVDPGHEPERVIKIARDAMSSLEIVLKQPAPGCRFIGYTEWSGEYIAVPVLSNYAKRNVYRGAIMTHLWAELHRAGIRQAIRLHEVHMLRGLKARGERPTDLLEILNGVDIFRGLSEAARTHLAEQMRSRVFAPGENVVTQAEQGDSLFIIVEGVVGVWVDVTDGKTIEVDRMGAGTFFGEMALLTGEPRTATIKAVTETVVFEITKDDVAPLIETEPGMSEILSRELTRRTLNRETKKRQYEATQEEEQALYLKIFAKIQAFFGKG